ncbi:MAG: class I SAM-dependent methyltransferase [Phycisphaerales bacterium]|nr:MAG: class I SAM-dependent methyltransferase [Phycisphaerales bacterium]
MREAIKQFVEIFAESFPVREPIYEFGSLQVPGQEGFADLRPFFADKEYVGCDLQEGPGVDRVLNLHDIDLPAETAGTVLALDTFEHVEYVRKAVQELHRILKPDGVLVASSVMKFPIHDFPYDYWRFTPEGFRSLMQPFGSVFVDIAGDEEFPHTVVGLGLKGRIPDDVMNDFKTKFGQWKIRWRKVPGKMHRRLHKLVTRPGQVSLFKRVRRT